MNKIPIMEEDKLHIEWFKEAGKCDSLYKLGKLAYKLFYKYRHDYGTVCHAISAFALAAAWYGAKKEGITGFQAGFVMWDFIKQWEFRNNKCGLKITNYDDLLYPQYEHRFDKIIKPERWESVQKEAKRRLQNNTIEKQGYIAHPDVVAHWQSIVDGKLPFGFKIKEDF